SSRTSGKDKIGRLQSPYPISVETTAQERNSRTFDEVGRFPAWNDREFPGKRRPVCRMAAPHHRKCGRTARVPHCERLIVTHLGFQVGYLGQNRQTECLDF